MSEGRDPRLHAVDERNRAIHLAESPRRNRQVSHRVYARVAPKLAASRRAECTLERPWCARLGNRRATMIEKRPRRVRNARLERLLASCAAA